MEGTEGQMGQGERGLCVRSQNTEDLCMHQLRSSPLCFGIPHKNSDEPASWVSLADASPCA